MNVNTQVHSFYLKDDGQIPNNPDLPVIVYQGIFNDNPNGIAETFQRHDWEGCWTGEVFEYQHYHSNSHEVLGVKSGEATLLLGGDSGERVEVKEGDVVVLPAGTGHKKVEGSPDFAVIGAYPKGSSSNLLEKDPGSRTQAMHEIRSVPVPEKDPVYGDEGPLLHKWVK
ncbi:cupin domain-containing protein [Bacillus sp. FJAT-27251]|uniref:cupin domain-containing protein n=1 Tax=Bacillus sp. FJAT-27251 TaxID=1684142 RepID=UPI0006A7C110|nr:cupin domain-containing protein [Bacillus sp. FJAT-27251]